jgi:hypothetical protein
MSTRTLKVAERAALALACVLGVACAVRGVMVASSPAQGEMVATIPGEIVALTADSGSEDALLVLDNRAERLMVYKQTQNGLQLFSSESVRDLFVRARLTSPD